MRKASFDKEEIEMLDEIRDVPNPPLIVGRKFRTRLSSNLSQVRLSVHRENLSRTACSITASPPSRNPNRHPNLNRTLSLCNKLLPKCQIEAI